MAERGLQRPDAAHRRQHTHAHCVAVVRAEGAPTNVLEVISPRRMASAAFVVLLKMSAVKGVLASGGGADLCGLKLLKRANRPLAMR